MLRLDYISCGLTILSTILVGRKLWQGWVVAATNSVLICFIGFKTGQFGFVPANLFCIALYSYNFRAWRRTVNHHDANKGQCWVRSYRVGLSPGGPVLPRRSLFQ